MQRLFLGHLTEKRPLIGWQFHISFHLVVMTPDWLAMVEQLIMCCSLVTLDGNGS